MQRAKTAKTKDMTTSLSRVKSSKTAMGSSLREAHNKNQTMSLIKPVGRGWAQQVQLSE